MSVDYRPDYDPADVNSDYGHTGGDITVPTFTGDTRPFRFWCQKALPLVYDDSLSYYEVLCKMADYMNNFMTDLTTVEDSMTEFGQQFVINQQFINSMADQLGQNVADLEAYINSRMDDFMAAYTQLQTYVNNYFDNLDVQQEINTKLDEMASDGTLNDLFDPVLETWMQQKTAQIDAAIANQDTIQAQQNSRISVLEGRMDTFEGLPSGSTAGNAELVGIRTNFLGEVYPTAGDAVRASDMIASGFVSIPFTRLEEWNENESSSTYDTIQFDVSAYKGGHIVMIANMDDFVLTAESIGVGVFASNVSGKTVDQNGRTYALTSNVFPSYSVIQTQIAGEERIALFFSIPEDFSYQYLKMGFVQEIPNGDYTQPSAIVYANSWSKTQVDPTLTIAGAAADAKAAGDAIDQLNERLSTFNNLRYVETLTEEMFERGSYSSGIKSDYNKNNRIRTLTKYVALNDIYIRLSGTESNARLAVEYFNNDGTFSTSQTWDSNATIKKGSYFDLILASSTTASATEIPVSDVWEMFTVTKEAVNIVSADADTFNVLPTTINRSNLFISSTTRISISDYIEIPDTFIFLAPDTGYAFYAVLYDEDFNIIDYGTKGWQTGNNFVTGGKYLRVSLAKTNSAAIGVEEIEHLKIANTYPLSVEYAKDGNIISIAKDGINNSVSDYAPKYPRSSIYSLSQAYKQGFRSLMLHVQYTTDGVGVVYHDQTINAQARNTDGTTIATTVYIRQSTIAELDQYDFGIYFGSQYAGLKILRLNDALAFCKKIGVNVIIEPTIDLSANELTLLKTSIDHYNLSKNIGYVSNSVVTMLNIKTTFPYAWLLMWVNDETTLTNHFNTIKSLLTENNRVYIYTYAETVFSDTALQNLADNELGLVLQIIQTGREPSNIISALTTKPYTNGFVSQIMPAYVAGQYDSLNN